MALILVLRKNRCFKLGFSREAGTDPEIGFGNTKPTGPAILYAKSRVVTLAIAVGGKVPERDCIIDITVSRLLVGGRVPDIAGPPFKFPSSTIHSILRLVIEAVKGSVPLSWFATVIKY